MLKKAQEVIASGDVPAVVDFGIELDRTTKADTAQLNEIKEFLRGFGATEAADRKTEKTVEILGNLGTVSITYPAQSPKLRSGVDLVASEAGIPKHVFELLFHKRTVVDFKSGFVENLKKLDSKERGMILDLIELEDTTPRIFWPK
jgi:hypothetical protein